VQCAAGWATWLLALVGVAAGLRKARRLGACSLRRGPMPIKCSHPSPPHMPVSPHTQHSARPPAWQRPSPSPTARPLAVRLVPPSLLARPPRWVRRPKGGTVNCIVIVNNMPSSTHQLPKKPRWNSDSFAASALPPILRRSPARPPMPPATPPRAPSPCASAGPPARMTAANKPNARPARCPGRGASTRKALLQRGADGRPNSGAHCSHFYAASHNTFNPHVRFFKQGLPWQLY
jgi:hypothetical protein